ncbi:hypothetical protein [Stackebrandtia nassauensis]|uniref:Transmembrane protein n=1 Tax=Stackebrandtia nassauensis (strain DSM 44728 / CIP 108903 / NRRL B-16338 / NBRC 102104 / LLR-40K-21) TaxID=446470 RepID=D3Q8R2_STANL|nr:hypothetical protein [Stackebrandtia nassauensis]ADD44504.1 hypothetical protein Snas_4863 [Stackebrandtia nassauensis DSM 44728]
MLALSLPVFAVSCWLGCYLLARDPAKPLLRRMAVGLLGYAAAIGLAGVPVADVALLGVPAIAWTGVLLRLPADREVSRLDPWWRWGYAPVAALAVLAAALSGSRTGLAIVFALLAAGLVAAFAVTLRRHVGRAAGSGLLGLLLLVTVLFGLGIAGLLLGLDLLPSAVVLAGIGADLVVLGILVAYVDALDEGQRLRADLLRSAVLAALVALLFAAQVWLAMALGPGPTPGLTRLLYGCVGAAIVVQVLAAPVHRALDRLMLGKAVTAERAELRDAIDALPRRGPLDDVDAEEFARLTRRALSHYGDLGRLVSSPLTALPVIDARLAARGASDVPLERAAELKAVLREGIERLKPSGDFGLSDEWRHYNALHYVYVVGLRPYSQRARHDGLSSLDKKVLQWFRTAVPQRSLHNWQNAAARLIADTLRDM